MTQEGKIWFPESFEEGERIIQRLFPQKEKTISDRYGRPMGQQFWQSISSERQRFFNESFGDHIYARRDLRLECCSCPREEHEEIEKYILRVRQPKPLDGWESKFPEYSQREREAKFKEIEEKLNEKEAPIAKAMLLLWSVEPKYEELPLFSRGRSSQYSNKGRPSNSDYGELHKSTDYWFSTKDSQKAWSLLAEKFGDLSS